MIKDLALVKKFEELYDKNIYLFGEEKYIQAAEKILSSFGIAIEESVEWNESVSEYALSDKVKSEDTVLIVAAYFKEYEKMVSALNITEENLGDVYTFIGLLYASYFNLDKDKSGKLEAVLNIWIHNQSLIVKSRQERVGLYPMLMEETDSIPIIIFQPGKVGSNTVEHSLRLCGEKVYRAHGIEYASKHFDESFDAKKTIIDYIKSFKKVKMITLVREPIAKDIGHFFQKIAIEEQDAGWFIKGLMEKDFQQSFLNYLSVVSPFDFTNNKKQQFVDKLICHIDYIGQKNPNGAMWGWFEEELKNNLGIDVLAESFDTEKGYSIIEKDNIEMLIIKLEKLNSLEDVIRKFIGNDEFKIISTNQGESKSYKYIYKQFQKDVILPKEYVDYYYKDNAYTNHFYSEEERQKFLEKWEKHIE